IAQLRSELQSAVGNVGNGYYNLPPAYTCIPSTGGPQVSTGARPGVGVGQNTGCTFIGEVLQFGAVAGGNPAYTIYPVFGLQYVGDKSVNGEAYDLATSKPQTVTAVSNLAKTTALPYGISVSLPTAPGGMGGIYYTDSSGKHQIGAIGILTTFNGKPTSTGGAGFAKVTQFSSGSQNVNLDPIPTSSLSDNSVTATNKINQLTDDSSAAACGATGLVCLGGPPTAPKNPASGIMLCFNSGTTQESALMTIGGSNSPASVTLTRFSKADCV
ncbi:MAG: hypothetical protein ACREGF_04550, partial [Candidatus Saccharimonadales bacterium]